MHNIALSTNWSEWQQVVSGTGALSITDGVLSVDADSTSSAYLRYNIEINADERVVFECDALATNVVTGPVIAIDSPPSTQKALKLVDNKTLQRLSVSYQPYFKDGRATISVVVGVYSTISGAGKFINPRIRIESASCGNDRLIARGLINFNGTAQTVTMSGTHQSFGLSLALETYAIRCTLNYISAFNTNRRPHVKVTQTATSQTTEALMWVASAPDVNGSFTLQAFRLATGARVTLTSNTSSRDIFIEVTE